MDDNKFEASLEKQNISEEHKSEIRTIASKLIDFIEENGIDLNPLEKERLSLYILHYRNSHKAASHIYPIKLALERIPNCINEMSKIIERTRIELIEEEFIRQREKIHKVFLEELNKKSEQKENHIHHEKERKRRISNIQNFIYINKNKKSGE